MNTWAQCFSKIYIRNLRIFILSYFIPEKPFQPSLMFVGKARSLLGSGAS
jgi:hypothetical protein